MAIILTSFVGSSVLQTFFYFYLSFNRSLSLSTSVNAVDKASNSFSAVFTNVFSSPDFVLFYPATMSYWDKTLTELVTTSFLAKEAMLLIICLWFALSVALSSLFNFSLLFLKFKEQIQIKTINNLDGWGPLVAYQK